VSKASEIDDKRASRLSEFRRTLDRIEVIVPDEFIKALGWQDNDAIELSVDADGNIICQKATDAELRSST